jgi:hypothetical protein
MLKSLTKAHILFAYCLLTSVCRAEMNPDTLWARPFCVEDSGQAAAIRLCHDGGYVLAGALERSGDADIYVVKTDSLGAIEWTHRFVRTSNETANDIRPALDGGFVVAGTFRDWPSAQDEAFLMKLNADGQEEWSQHFGGSEAAVAYAVRPMMDGGFAIAGAQTDLETGRWDVYLVRTDSMGRLLWSRTFGGPRDDWASAICETEDGGLLAAGPSNSFGLNAYHHYIVKTDRAGKLLWWRAIAAEDKFWTGDVVSTADGWTIAGSAYSAGRYAGSSPFLLMIDRRGGPLSFHAFWQHEKDYEHSMLQAVEGGYMAAVFTFSFGDGVREMYLARTDSAGEEWWMRTYNRTGLSRVGIDGGYWRWEDYDPFARGVRRFFGIVEPPGRVKLWLRSALMTPILPERDRHRRVWNQLNVVTFALPHPSHVNLCVQDVRGTSVQTLAEGLYDAGDHTVFLNSFPLRSGVYFVHFEAGETVRTQKLVLVK